MTAIRSKAILTTLGNKCNGDINCPGGDDAVTRLMLQMGVKLGQRQFMLETLDRMADQNELTVERKGSRVTRITVVKAEKAPIENTTDSTKGEDGMPQRRGQRRTTWGTLGSQGENVHKQAAALAGPVELRYVNPQAGEEINAAAELVVEQLRLTDSPTQGHAEIAGTVQMVLWQLYPDSDATVEALTDRVIACLIHKKILARKKIRGEQPAESMYDVTLPSEEEVAQAKDAATAKETSPTAAPVSEPKTGMSSGLSPQQAMALLMKRIEEISADRDDLRRQNETLQEKLKGVEAPTTVNPRLLAATVKKIEELELELKRSAAENERLKRAHTTEIAQLRTNHGKATKALQAELASAKTIQEGLERQLKENAETEIDPETMAKLKELGLA